jgi:hypothetical protein
MPGINGDIDAVISAMESLRLITSSHANSRKGVALIEDVVEMLAMLDRGGGPYGGLRKTVADAVSKAFLNKPFGT